MSQRFSHVVIAFGFLIVLSGCASWTTYPPIPGAAQMGRTDYEPGPAIMATAIRYSHDRHAKAIFPDDEVVINLPEGLPADVYERVIRRLAPELNARPMRADDRWAIHVKSVRVRAFDSQVDVVYPRPDGHHEMIMLTMRQNVLNQHRVTGSRLWRIQVAAPPAHYVPAPPRTRDGHGKSEVVAGEAEAGADATPSPEVQAGVISDDVNE